MPTAGESISASYNLAIGDSLDTAQWNAERDVVAPQSEAASSDHDDDASTTPRRSPCLRSPELVELIVCVSYAAIAGVILSMVEHRPHQRPIPYQYLDNSGDYVVNLSYNEEVTSETVPSWLLRLCSLILPLSIQLILSLLGDRRRADVHATLCVYAVAMTTNAIATVSVKLYVGYLRPIFYSLCQPDEDFSTCTNSDSSQLRMSFPSGHASESFCGLTLLTLYVHTRFGVASQRYYRRRHGEDTWIRETLRVGIGWARLASLGALAPMGLALWIAASRVVDNRHFPADVVAGSLLGAAISSYTHGLWLE
jgi:membrane-associated phospholipid phosphatase